MHTHRRMRMRPTYALLIGGSDRLLTQSTQASSFVHRPSACLCIPPRARPIAASEMLTGMVRGLHAPLEQSFLPPHRPQIPQPSWRWIHHSEAKRSGSPLGVHSESCTNSHKHSRTGTCINLKVRRYGSLRLDTSGTHSLARTQTQKHKHANTLRHKSRTHTLTHPGLGPKVAKRCKRERGPL